MVSKLVFKGEKPKKKRKVASSENTRQHSADAAQRDKGMKFRLIVISSQS